MLGLLFLLTAEFMLSPPSLLTFFIVKKKVGEGGLPCIFWDHSRSAKNREGGNIADHIYFLMIIVFRMGILINLENHDFGTKKIVNKRRGGI